MTLSENPQRIAVIGAGPIGIEAALYARYLGYQVDLLEQSAAAENVRRVGHVRIFSPFRMLRSTLGLAALAAQDPGYRPPPDEEWLRGIEWVERYLEPLVGSDLLADSFRPQVQVLAIARTEALKQEWPGSTDRADSQFRLLLQESAGQSEIYADVVIDCSGVLSNPNWLGQGGAPAVGETSCRQQIDYHLPDLLERDRQRFLGQRVLVVGNGHSAATSIVQLVKLIQQDPKTNVTWAIRRKPEAGPVPVVPNDPLVERQRLTAEANRVAGDECVELLPATSVHEIQFDHQLDEFRVVLVGDHQREAVFDRVIANVGYQGDQRIHRELHVHECYASGGPMKLAASLMAQCRNQHAVPITPNPEILINPEPNFYVLGAKSYGRAGGFLYANGIQQVRDLFTIIGERADLDLYQSAVTLLDDGTSK